MTRRFRVPAFFYGISLETGRKGERVERLRVDPTGFDNNRVPRFRKSNKCNSGENLRKGRAQPLLPREELLADCKLRDKCPFSSSNSFRRLRHSAGKNCKVSCSEAYRFLFSMVYFLFFFFFVRAKGTLVERKIVKVETNEKPGFGEIWRVKVYTRVVFSKEITSGGPERGNIISLEQVKFYRYSMIITTTGKYFTWI